MSKVETEVLIIGGGVLGTAIARELAKYRVDVTLVEKEVDFGWGCTKASATTVCQGGNCLEFRKGYHRSKLVWESIPMMEPLCQELDVPFKRIGELGIIRNAEQLTKYQKMKAKAEEWIPSLASPQFIDRDTLRSMEPNLTKEAIGALYDPLVATTDPVRLTIALAENAAQNGVVTMTETEVLDILPRVGEFEVQTNQGAISSRLIVNAAGVFADRVARMVNADDFVLFPVKAYIAILDKTVGGLISHAFAVHGEPSMMTPSVHGNIFFGIPLQQSKRNDSSTTQQLSDIALKNAQRLVPDISGRYIINSFVGYFMLRNFELGWHECVVRLSTRVPGFINVSMGYPGVSAAPATAKEVIALLGQVGLKLEANTGFNPHREAIVHFNELSEEEKRALIAKDSRYGHVVCRCETVTEGEVVEAIKEGATTLDGVKFRTRAGMGRCQSGFCGPRVMSILSRELGITEEKITKKGGDSQYVLYNSKELLEKIA